MGVQELGDRSAGAIGKVDVKSALDRRHNGSDRDGGRTRTTRLASNRFACEEDRDGARSGEGKSRIEHPKVNVGEGGGKGGVGERERDRGIYAVDILTAHETFRRANAPPRAQIGEAVQAATRERFVSWTLPVLVR